MKMNSPVRHAELFLPPNAPNHLALLRCSPRRRLLARGRSPLDLRQITAYLEVESPNVGERAIGTETLRAAVEKRRKADKRQSPGRPVRISLCKDGIGIKLPSSRLEPARADLRDHRRLMGSVEVCQESQDARRRVPLVPRLIALSKIHSFRSVRPLGSVDGNRTEWMG